MRGEVVCWEKEKGEEGKAVKLVRPMMKLEEPEEGRAGVEVWVEELPVMEPVS